MTRRHEQETARWEEDAKETARARAQDRLKLHRAELALEEAEKRAAAAEERALQQAAARAAMVQNVAATVPDHTAALAAVERRISASEARAAAVELENTTLSAVIERNIREEEKSRALLAELQQERAQVTLEATCGASPCRVQVGAQSRGRLQDMEVRKEPMLAMHDTHILSHRAVQAQLAKAYDRVAHLELKASSSKDSAATPAATPPATPAAAVSSQPEGDPVATEEATLREVMAVAQVQPRDR